ncbi:MAG TPA: LysR family transcriptional regulator [Coriobacteriia bacterium]|nr:LysR family transcriptional regulator [Coriobacteriia bacterium]
MLREVASRGTIAAAAESLFMSPSAVSQQMAVLEREAGLPLLEREGRGVRLTAAGRKLVRNTERILAEIEHAEADLATASSGVVGQLRLSAFPTAARAILIPALVQLGHEHPNLSISTIDLEPEESLPALKNRDLDVVLTYEWDVLPSLEDPGIEREELLIERVSLALPETHPAALRGGPVAIADLVDEQWIVGRDSTSMLDLVKAAANRAGFEPQTGIHTMDFGVILAAVGAGLGVALGPQLAFTEQHPGVAVREIADLNLNRSIWAAIRRGSGSTPGIAAALSALRVSASALAERLPSLEQRPSTQPD